MHFGRNLKKAHSVIVRVVLPYAINSLVFNFIWLTFLSDTSIINSKFEVISRFNLLTILRL